MKADAATDGMRPINLSSTPRPFPTNRHRRPNQKACLGEGSPRIGDAKTTKCQTRTSISGDEAPHGEGDASPDSPPPSQRLRDRREGNQS